MRQRPAPPHAAPKRAAREPARRTPRRAAPAPRATAAPALSPMGVAACLLLAAPAGFATPQGAVLVSGQATVRQTTPGQMDIQQSTPRAQLDWTNFSIAAGERVNVMQPDRTSVLLNRVIGDNPSLIYGSLTSNGSVWLVNPRGIIFGANSRVDVGSLVATTLSISSQDLASGRIQLGAGAGSAGELRSEGTINATDSVILVSPQLMHSGQISARRVGLAAASEVLVDVEGDGLIFFNVRNDRLDAKLALLGSVRADGGSAEIRAAARAGFADTVLNMEGIVQARSLGRQEGRIVVDGGSHGVTRVAGTLDASAAGDARDASGGQVTVLGQQVQLAGTARLDASGPAGGGTIRVGGDYQGSNAELHNATTTTVAEGAVINADATVRGDGGRVIVWSDDTTLFDGRITVRGGAEGGNGGFVETSGKLNLGVQKGSVSVAASAGRGGTWLLDPATINVITGGAAPYANVNDSSAQPGTTQNVAPTTLVGVGGNVILDATVTINVNSDLALTAAGATLTMQAGSAINVNADVSTNNGAISFSSGAGGFTLLSGKTVNAGNSTITIDANGGGTSGNVTLAGSLTTTNITNSAILIRDAVDVQLGNLATGGNAGRITLNFSGAGTQAAATSISAGSVLKTGTGTLTLSNVNAYGGGTEVNNGTLNIDGSGTAGAGNIDVGSQTLDVTNAASVGNAIVLADNGTLSSSAGSGTLTGAALSIGNNDTLRLSAGSGSVLAVDGVISGSNGGSKVAVSGAGVVSLKGANTYAGGTTVSNGTLQINGATATAGTGTIALDDHVLDIIGGATVDNLVTLSAGATIKSSSGTGAFDHTLNLGNGGALKLGGGTGTLTVVKVLSDGSNDDATVSIEGGTVVLKAANSYGGDTTVNAGTLQIDGSGRAGDNGKIVLGANTLAISGGASVDTEIDAITGATIRGGAGGGTLAAGTLDLANAATLNLNGAAGTLTVERVIPLVAGAGAENVRVTGGSVVLTGANTYAGTTTIDAGAALALGDGGTTGAIGNGAVTVGTGGSLTLNRSGTLTLSNAISGAGELVQAGTGTTILTGTNSYGATTVSDGTLQVGNAGSTGTLGSGTITLGAAGTLRFNRTQDLTLTNEISGSGTLIQAGSSMLELQTASATFSGAVNVTGGTLRLSGGADRAGTGAIDLNARVLELDNANVTNTITVNDGATIRAVGTSPSTLGAGTLDLGTNVTLNLGATGTGRLDVTRVITDADDTGKLAVASGTVVLKSANTYGGNTTVSGGTLRLDGGDAGNGGAIALGAAGTLDIVGGGNLATAVSAANGATIASSDGTGTLASGGGALTLADGATLNLSGGSGTLVVARAISAVGGAPAEGVNVTGGTVQLTATNTYAGNTDIGAGATLTLGAGGTSGSIAAGNTVSIGNGGTLRIDRSDGITLSGAISGATGGLVQDGAGTTILTGTNSYGNTTVNAGVLQVGNNGTAGTLGTGTVNLAAGTLRVDRTDELTLGNTFSGAGTLDQHGSGATVLTANSSSFSGAVNITGGTLRLSGTNAKAGTGAIAIGSHTLDIADGATVTNDISVAGGRIISSTGGGTLGAGTAIDLGDGGSVHFGSAAGGPLGIARVLADGGNNDATVTIDSGNVALRAGNTYGGDTTVTAGVLQIDGGAAGNAGKIVLGANTLEIRGGSSVTTTIDASNGATIRSNTGGGTLAAGTLNLADGATLNLAGGGGTTLTVARAITDVAGGSAEAINVTAGTVVLTGTNTYIGDTTISAAAALSLGAGGTAGSLATGNAVSIGSGGTLSINRSDSVTLSGDISGAGALVQAGGGTTILTGTNSYGATTVSAGVLQIGNAGTAGTLGGGAVTLSGGTLRVDRTDTLSLANVFSGTGAFDQHGSGTTVLTADSSAGYSGTVNVTGGALGLSGTNAKAGTGTIALGANTLDIAAGASVGNTITVANGATITSSSGGGTLAAGTLNLGAGVGITLSSAGGGTLGVARVISDTANDGTLAIGGGTVALRAAGTYGGNTTVTAGTLQIDGGTAGNAGSIVLGGNTLDIVNASSVSTAVTAGNGATIRSSTGGGALAAGTLTLADGATLNLAGAAGSTLTVARVIADVAGGATEAVNANGGTVVLSGANTYAGDTTVTAGTLRVSGATATAGTGDIVLGTHTLDITGGASVGNTVTVANGATITSGSGGGTLGAAGALNLGTGVGVTLSSAGGGTLTIARAVTDTSNDGTLTINGGTVALQGANTHGGDTTVTAGTLRIDGGSAGDGSIVLGANTLDIVNASSLATAVSAANGATISSSTGNGTLAAGTLTLADGATLNLSGGAASTLTVARAIPVTAGGAAESVSVGTGTVVLTGANTYTGSTGIANGATLVLGNGATAGSLAGGAIAIAGGGTLRISHSDTLTLANVLSGSGTLVQQGSGTTALTADSSAGFSGAVNVSAGTLRLSGANAKAGTGTIALGANTLDITGGASVTNTVTASTGATISSSVGDGTLAAGTLTLADGAALNLNAGASSTLTVARAIPNVAGGAAETVAIGGGTIVFTGANAYTGSTSIASGATLQLGAGGTAGSLAGGTVDIASGATLRVDRSDALTLANVLSGTGSFDQHGSGTTALTADSSAGFSGAVDVTGGTLRLSGAGARAGTGTLTLGSHTLDIAGGASVANAIDASSGASITSSSGNGTLAAGTLTLADGATLNLAGGGASTLTVARTIPTVAGGAAESVAITGGTVALTAANSYDGGTTVSAGTLRITGATATAGSGTVALGSGTLDITGGASVANTLTVADGATVRSSSGGGTLAAGTLTLGNNVGLTLAGAGGSTLTVARTLTDSAANGRVTASGGTVLLTADNNWQGTTTIASGATLVAGAGGATGSIGSGAVANDGVLRINRDTSSNVSLGAAITGTGTVEQVGTGTTVLAADNGYGNTVVSAGVLQVGTGGNTGTLGLGSITVDNPGALRFNRAGTLTVPGSITGSGRLELAGSGVAELVSSGLYTGGTSILAGTLRIVGAGASAGTGTIAIGSGTLDITGGATVTNLVTIADGGSISNSSGAGTLAAHATPLTLTNGSTLNLSSSGTGLTVQRIISDGAGTASVVVSGSGAGQVTLSAANAYDGSTHVGSGALVAGLDAALAAGSSLIVDGGSFDLGTRNIGVTGVSLRSGSITGTSGVLTSTSDHDLRSGTVTARLGGNVGLTKSTAGTVTISGSQAYTGTTSVSAGTLALGGDNVFANGGAVVVNGGTLDLGTHVDTVGTLSLQAGAVNGSTGTLTATSYTLAGGTVAGNLGTGTLTSSGTVLLSGTAAATAVDVTGGTLTLGGSERLANNATLRVLGGTLALGGTETVGSLELHGALGGSGTLTAGSYALVGGSTLAGANLGSGTLSSSGSSTLGGTAAAGSVSVAGGELLLDGAQRLAAGATVNVNGGATLRLAGAQTVQTLNVSGTLAGSGQTLSTTDRATLGAGADVAANLGGTRVDVTGNATLSGTANVTALNVNAGRLTLASGGRLGAATDVAVNGTSELRLGGDETVHALSLTGALTGAGTLTATNYTLEAGASTASGSNLGAGTLTVNGNATLAGTAAAGTVAVDAGTLTLAAADRLAAGATVNVNAGSLLLTAAQTVQTLNLSGTLAGAGQTLTTTDRATLNTGANVQANLAGPRLDVAGNATLAGTAAATTVNVDAGKLTLASAGRLAAGAAVIVDAGAELALGGNETVTRVESAGTLSGGAATLTAPNVVLREGAVVTTRLGVGQLDVEAGDTLGATLSATSAAATVNVNTGTLKLTTGNLLDDNAAVTVASGATLTLNGNDTIGALAVSGTVNGTGILNAGTYLLTEGNYELDIGSGAIISRGRSRLIGSVGASLVTIESGVLTLGSAGRFTNAPTVNIFGPGTLNLNGDETLGSLAGAGTLDLRGATLTTGSRGDSSFTGTLLSSSGAGALLKVGTSTFSLGGTGSYTGLTRVMDGVLNVSGTLASTTMQVDAIGTLNVQGADRLADSAAVSVAAGGVMNLDNNDRIGTLSLLGRLGGTGTLTATSYTLDGGTVDANLGSGQLHSSGSSRLNGSAAVNSVGVDGGTLVLGGSQQFSALPAVTVAGGAALQLLNGDQTLGSLAGGGNVALGAQTLATGAGGSSSFDGVISGSGDLVKQGTSSFTLTGSQAYLGTTRVAAGTLILAAAERLADSGAVLVDSGATLDLRGDEHVGSLALSGRLIGGNRTLTAATYLLDGGTLDAQLGAGTLTSRGASTINGSAAASSVTVENGTLTLAGTDRLSALPALTVNSGGQLLLGGDQALGTLAGTGTVDIANHQLSTGSGGDSHFGGAITGAGTLVKTGAGTFTLDGTSAAATLRVDAGTLALAAADRLADAAAVNVASGATLSLAGNDRVASLTLAGALGGSGTLTAASYTLNAGRVDADLGAGTLTSHGSSRINGLSAATVNVADGTLTLGSSNRLADTVAVAVASGATLALDGTDTVASLTLAGTLAGSGTLGAGTYTLDSGLVQANLGAGALTSRGNSTIAGQAAAQSVAVQTGTLTLAGANRLSGLPTVQVDGGAQLALGGDQTFGTLAGGGQVALAGFTLSTGSGGDSIFAGVIGGSGGLTKQGSASSFTLTGANTYAGVTRVAGGTLRIGDGGTAGALSSSRFEVDGTLVFARSDNVQLAQEVSGTGGIEQAGSGRLTFSGANKHYSGATRVSSGDLATAASGDLSATSTVNIATGGRLLLAGSETVRGIDADGSIALQTAGASLTATDSLLMRGAVTSVGSLALTAGQRVLASSAGNRFGGALALNAGGRIDVTSGVENGNTRELTLGTLVAGAGGRIDAGATTFAADATVNGGRLELVSTAAQGAVAADESGRSGFQITGLPIAFAADGVSQGNAGRISVAAGAGLSITTSNGASVQLLRTGNSFLGELSVVTGAPNVAWTANSTNVSIGGGGAQNYAVQSRVRVEGTTVNVGGDGIVADVVNIRADRVATVGSTATIVARMPFDASVGTAVSMPALTLELTPEAFAQSFPFGSASQGLRVDVGSQAYGGRTLPLNAGYITVLPRNGAQGSTAVLLNGPQVGAYRFFFAGAGVQTEIPVFYNGVLPTTPQVQNSISATLSVSEGARKDRFEEAVRTENVAVRLRGGVIAEVGPAPSATQGTDGIRVPAACTPAAGLLQCGAP